MYLFRSLTMNNYVYGLAIFAIVCTSLVSALKEEDCEGKFRNLMNKKSNRHLIPSLMQLYCSVREDSGRIWRYTQRWSQIWHETNRRRIQKILPHCQTEATETGESMIRRVFFPIFNSLTDPLLFSQCYYLGGSETSATGILGELSRPLSWSMPALKICEKLKKLDNQICDLRFGKFPTPRKRRQSTHSCHLKLINLFHFIFRTEKQIDLSTVDLKKLKVRDLKKVLNDWDEVCDGCLEKTDYIRRIEELKPKYYKEEL